MEIIVRNLHDQITEKQVDNFFKGVLGQIGVHTFHCQKLKGRGCATITILDAGKAKQFLKLHGQTLNGAKGHATVLHKLAHMGRPVNCLKSNHPPDPYLLLSLKKEESERYTANQSKKPTIVPAIEYFKPSRDRRAFDVKSLSCGQWTYVGRDLAFVPYFQDSQTGRMIFGPRSLMLKIGPYKAKLPSSQIEITYDSVHSFTVGPKSNPSITLNLVQAPKLFETLPIETTDTQLNNLENALRNLTVARSNQQHSRKRIAALNKAHETVVAGCLCYRVVLINAADIAGIQALRRFEEIPDSMTWNTSAVMRIPFAAQMTTLHNTLAGKRFSTLPFSIKFQIQKLAQNGYLEPSKVLELLPVVASHFQKNQSPTTVAESIRNLGGYLPFAGPETDAAELNIEAFSDYLVQNQTAIVHGESYVNDLAEQHDHIASIHKVTITPTGTYLYGPDPETKNRVLRKYSDYLDYFLSVSFLDEDGEPLRLDRQTSGQEIYQGRFKKALRSGINIAGRQYEVHSQKFCGC